MMRMAIKYLTAHSCSTEVSVTGPRQPTGTSSTVSSELRGTRSNESVCFALENQSVVRMYQAHLITCLLLHETQLCHAAITVTSSKGKKLNSL